MENTTRIRGYYNGHKWPVQINVAITLQPGEYIVDKNGRKVNDPYFETFAKNKQLHRELSSQPVPINPLNGIPTGGVPDSKPPVRVITKQEAKQTIVPQVSGSPVAILNRDQVSKLANEPKSINSAVLAMSVEEARNKGFIRKVREVPDDYGVPDTGQIPPRDIPPIKYSIDPTVTKQIPALPEDAIEEANDIKDPKRKALLTSITKTKPVVQSPEAASGKQNLTAKSVNPDDSFVPVGRTGQQEPNVPHTVNKHSESISELDLDETQDYVLPEPDLEEFEYSEEKEDDKTEAISAAQEQIEESPARKLIRPLTPKNRFNCPSCGQPYQFASQLINHIRRVHRDDAEAIIEQLNLE